ncbi:MAG: N-acetyltransferase [Roseburia sp.]|nr:N-acetyltransferase [Roseburia sp.]
MTAEIRIRVATLADAAALLKIYAPYVEKTAITFDYEVPTVKEFTDKIQRLLKKYPVLVAENADGIVGYAYADSFKNKAAYDWAVETTIYVDENCKKMGIGKRLYEELEQQLRALNIVNLNACIAYPVEEDEYLAKDSVRFHEKLGYRMVGEFRQCGYKFHRWYNMVWMEKHIGEHLANQPKVRWFEELQEGLSQ